MSPTAPPIDGQAWIGSTPVNANQLQGRVVVLVFWAASCEASLGRLQQIEALLKRLTPNPVGEPTDPDLLAIAVHSPRMPIDDDVGRLEHTIARHRITIPVVHDPRFETWNRYEPPGWPSTAIIDRSGRVTGMTPGCQDIETVEDALRLALGTPQRRRRSDQDRMPVEPNQMVSHEAPPVSGWPQELNGSRLDLHYPEGLALLTSGEGASVADPIIAIADTGHDRVIIARISPDRRQATVDTQFAGLGQPAGLAFLDENRLAVVEREHNVVSAINIDSGQQTAIAAELVRPTGLAVDVDGSLVIADSGADQLYRAVANSNQSGYLVKPIAGSGRTGTKPGDAGMAELAQPSAVTRTNAGLLFCDAASSNLRLLTDDGQVVNITNSDLFDWGLVDGRAHRAKLQRPSGLCHMSDGSVLVADRGNNRLRRLHQRRIETLGLAGLASPSALVAIDRDFVLVADTDNHRVTAIGPESQMAWPLDLVLDAAAKSASESASRSGSESGSEFPSRMPSEIS